MLFTFVQNIWERLFSLLLIVFQTVCYEILTTSSIIPSVPFSADFLRFVETLLSCLWVSLPRIGTPPIWFLAVADNWIIVTVMNKNETSCKLQVSTTECPHWIMVSLAECSAGWSTSSGQAATVRGLEKNTTHQTEHRVQLHRRGNQKGIELLQYGCSEINTVYKYKK